MTTMASQITSLAVVYSTVYSDADQRKHQSSALLAFVWGIHRARWIPRTNGQLRGKCFHLMTSSWQKQISVIFKFDWLNRMVWPWSHRFKYIFLITPQSLKPQASLRYFAFYTIPLHWQGPTHLTMGLLYIRFLYWTKDNQQDCFRLNNFAVFGVVYELLTSCVVL